MEGKQNVAHVLHTMMFMFLVMMMVMMLRTVDHDESKKVKVRINRKKLIIMFYIPKTCCMTCILTGDCGEQV